jgi:2-keto-4-pentenoate hydratase/2-oxohepta-3-ene-1,7-dioic acid hydratase in catechol pathway
MSAPQKPGTIICVGRNYGEHAQEQGVDPPASPVLFAKWPNTVIFSGEAIVIPSASRQVDFEGELGVVIGAIASRVRAAEALNYVEAYFAANDVSARDVQFGDGQWTRGKSFDTFLPMSDPTPSRDVSDPQNLRIRTLVNGRVMQDSNTSEMIFDIPTLIEFITEDITLVPGDVILTGTPSGVGAHRKPPVWLCPGDIVVVEIDGVGKVTSPVAAAF